MFQSMRAIPALLIAAMMAAVPVNAGNEDSSVAEWLPQNVRQLLRQEMVAILGASQTILDALVRGDDATVARQAQAIHQSFIMKQQLTEADRAALKQALPKAFIRKDRAFHQLAAKLAEQAEAGNSRGQQKLFEKMIDACVACHREHAGAQFQF